MPTYDYVCDACGHGFEHFQSMSDPHLKQCPKCSKKKLRRLIGTGAGLIFKGSGFYITDYKKSSSSESKGSSDSSAAKESKKSPSSTKDSKSSKDSKGSAGSS